MPALGDGWIDSLDWHDFKVTPMRMLLLAALVFTVPTCALLAEPGSYSVRDAGFVEAPQPFRLVVLARDPTAADVKRQHTSLLEEMRDSNVVLVHYPTDP